MSEKPIIAYFNSPEQAKVALQTMKNAFDVIDASIDRIDGYPGDGADPDNPITGEIPSLSSLTLGGDFSRNAGILGAASVDASGLSSGGPDNMTSGVNIILSATVKEENGERAMKIVRDCGAI
jgi:hypothetical protein